MKIDTEGARDALAGENSVSRFSDYRGEYVIGAHYLIESVGWGLIVKVDEAEVLASVSALRMISLALVIGLMVIVSFIAVWASRALSSPIILIAENAQ